MRAEIAFKSQPTRELKVLNNVVHKIERCDIGQTHQFQHKREHLLRIVIHLILKN